MKSVQLKIKLLDKNATIPTRGSEEAAGYDLYSAEEKIIQPGTVEKISTGIAMELPQSTFGAIYPRSGLSAKQGLRLANCVGVCDSDYRGPYTKQAVLELTNGKRYILPKGMFSDAARIGMATGYAASMVQDATPQQKAFGITYGNTYLSSILNTTEPQQTKWVDSNAVSIP